MQRTVSLSSAESELNAVVDTTKEVMALQDIIAELREFLRKGAQEDVRVMVDNTATIQMLKNPMHYGRAKHIQVRYHFMRDMITQGHLRLQHVASTANVADIFTKPLSPEIFKRHRHVLFA